MANSKALAYLSDLESLKTELQATIVSSIKSFYPVGSIYMSLSPTNPAIIFGFGTWELVDDLEPQHLNCYIFKRSA